MIAVITGASSGIGRATAFEFARKGYELVLAARFGAGLDEVVEECNRLGGSAVAVPTDVSKEEDVHALAFHAQSTFGGFDVWVNNAAVGLFGHFEEIPTEDIRQLMEINVFGYIYGARAAIRQFRLQGYGTLINVSSMAALVGQPFSIPYTMSKFAVRGMSISLTQELADEEDIHVCCVLPSVIDTPIFQHAGNYMGKAVKAPNPVIPAKRVAKAIYRLTKKPQEQVTVGNMSRMMRFQRMVSPALLFDKYMQKMIAQNHFKNKPSGSFQGNLYEPMTNWNKVNGGWLPEDSSKKGKTFGVLAGVALAGAVGYYLLQHKKGSGYGTTSRQRSASSPATYPVAADYTTGTLSGTPGGHGSSPDMTSERPENALASSENIIIDNRSEIGGSISGGYGSTSAASGSADIYGTGVVGQSGTNNSGTDDYRPSSDNLGKAPGTTGATPGTL
ncbi:SDR family oxidoreductase [Rufibacter sp. XAAS-G3-1]|uniref:SDR family oxidoreductase n=1 Tax=Rufibacter sp. XAAS-G3-1 TaxID=2729134 RepID=UPI0015E75927|nr:SDR family oxidoreductase [Rufibacter sp. XAAS-G3-1]